MQQLWPCTYFQELRVCVCVCVLLWSASNCWSLIVVFRRLFAWNSSRSKRRSIWGLGLVVRRIWIDHPIIWRIARERIRVYTRGVRQDSRRVAYKLQHKQQRWCEGRRVRGLIIFRKRQKKLGPGVPPPLHACIIWCSRRNLWESWPRIKRSRLRLLVSWVQRHLEFFCKLFTMSRFMIMTVFPWLF